jgi:type IV pilus assembly protein PilO
MNFGIRELIFLAILLAVPAASFFYVFKPRNDEIKTALVEIEQKQRKLNELEQVTKKIEDIGLEIEKGREAIQLIVQKLPDERDVAGILEQITDIASNTRLGVKSIKTNKPVPAAAYMELPLEMVIEGEFEGFYQFLLQVENLPRITRIHDMKIARVQPTSRTPGERTSGMKAEFTLSIFFEESGSSA